jgi:hypothetical protein
MSSRRSMRTRYKVFFEGRSRRWTFTTVLKRSDNNPPIGVFSTECEAKREVERLNTEYRYLRFRMVSNLDPVVVADRKPGRRTDLEKTKILPIPR